MKVCRYLYLCFLKRFDFWLRALAKSVLFILQLDSDLRSDKGRVQISESDAPSRIPRHSEIEPQDLPGLCRATFPGPSPLTLSGPSGPGAPRGRAALCSNGRNSRFPEGIGPLTASGKLQRCACVNERKNSSWTNPLFRRAAASGWVAPKWGTWIAPIATLESLRFVVYCSWELIISGPDSPEGTGTWNHDWCCGPWPPVSASELPGRRDSESRPFSVRIDSGSSPDPVALPGALPCLWPP